MTGVARDDLEDCRALPYVDTVRAIHGLAPGTGVESLIPGFASQRQPLRKVFESRREVLAHYIETVPQIFVRIRPALRDERSLDLIMHAGELGSMTKSSLMLDAGRESNMTTRALRLLVRHYPVGRLIASEESIDPKDKAGQTGSPSVLSGWLVRSTDRGRQRREFAGSVERPSA